jgi:prepilin-type N-terminal cleavage/methylation domain-containing protein
MKNSKGFTLIELLIVLMIFGILLAIATVSGSAWMNRYNVESQTKVMYANLLSARANAMKRNRTYFAVFTATRYSIYEDSNPAPDGNGTLETGAGGDTQVLQTNLNAKYAVTMTPAAAVVDTINFGSKGLVSWSLGVISVPTVTQQTMYVTSRTYGAAYDCIVIELTRLTMGVWDGATCKVQ